MHAGEAAAASRVPRTAAMELTLACNARCIHCGSTAGRPRDDELDPAAFASVFADLASLGGEEVCLLGGEPFLHPQWFEIASDAGKRGLGVVFITNGAPVDRTLAKRLAGLPGLARVAVSVDGACAEVHDGIRRRRGSFREATEALSLLQERGVEAGAITTVMRDNLEELPRLRDLLAGRDLGWQVQVAGNAGGRFGEEHFLRPEDFYRVGVFLHETRKAFSVEELPVAGAHDVGYFSSFLEDYGEKPQHFWRGCPAGIEVVGVTSDGGVKACLSLPDAFVEGNVRRRPLADLWRDPDRFARNRRFNPSQLKGFCASCEYGPLCRAGCMELCLSTTGTPWENRFCFHRIETERGPRKGGLGL